MITIVQNTQEIFPAYSVNGNPFIASSSIANDANLKMVTELYVENPSTGDGSGTYVYVNKDSFHRNPTDNYFHYNPNEVLKNYVGNNFNPFLIADSTGCTNSIRYYKIFYGEEFTTQQFFTSTQDSSGFLRLNITSLTGVSVNDQVTVVMDSYAYNPQYQNVWTATSVAGGYVVLNCPYGSVPTITETGRITKIRHIQGSTSGKCVYNGTKQFFDKGVEFKDRFDLTGSTGQWLTNYNYTAYPYQIREDEVATLSCIVKTYISNPLLLVKYRTYDVNGTAIGVYNSDVNTATSHRLDIPTGTYNLALMSENNTLTSTVEPIFSSAVKTYTVQMYVGTAPISKLVNYNVICTDNRFTPLRYCFENLQGGIDYFTFEKKWYYSAKIKKEEIETQLDYNYQLSDRGNVTTNVDVEEYGEVNTNWINDYENVLVSELLKSRDVNFISNGLASILPVTFIVTDFQQKRKATNDLFQYKLKNKIAYPNIVQSA